MKSNVLRSFLAIAIFTSGIIFFNRDASKEIFKGLLSKTYLENFRDGPAVDDDHIITKLDNGMRIVVNKNDRCVCWFVRMFGRWDPNETAAIHALVKHGSSIIEVGANFGVHTLRMAEIVGEKGQIHAFEANPHVSKYLKQSVHLNHLDKIITVYEKAAGNYAGDVYLSFSRQNIGDGHLVVRAQDNTVKTTVVRLDDHCKLAKVDILKIDAEGCEAKIIQGSQKLITHNDDIIIIMEWCPRHLINQGSDPEHLIKLLKTQGFKAWCIGTHQNGRAKFVPISFEKIKGISHCDLVLSRKTSI